MQRKDVTTRLGIAAIALASLAWSATGAIASAIAYDTSGGSDGATYNGKPGNIPQGTFSVGFNGVTGGSFSQPGTNLLGSLVVKPTPGGTEGVYNDVPFNIRFTAPDLHKVVTETLTGNGGVPFQGLAQYDAIFTLFGHLDGTVQPDGKADLTYTVDGFRPFSTALVTTDRVYLSDLPFPTSALTAGPTFHLVTPAGGGSVAISVQVVPEPSTLAFALVGVAGLVLRRRLARRA
ncbi:MAG TPA: PEP-CTERM sorting domain-containing protein [Isosphaeraceae bacterium]